MPSDTAVLPIVTPSDCLPPPGTYPLRHDRCVIEVSLRPMGFPLVRRRIRAVAGELAVGEEHLLTVELTTGIRFTATELVADGRRRLRIVGQVDIDGTRRTLRMAARVVHLDTDTIVLSARGVLAPPRVKRRATGVAARRLHIETAVEFSR